MPRRARVFSLDMSNITVIGGNGYTGAAVVSEALARGHHVTVVSRSQPYAPLAGVSYVTGSALEVSVLDRALDGADAVVSAITSRGAEADDGAGERSVTDAVRRVRRPGRCGALRRGRQWLGCQG